MYCIAGLFPYIGANFPEWSVLSFSRNFPDLEIHDPNNWKAHVNEISQSLHVYMNVWRLDACTVEPL